MQNVFGLIVHPKKFLPSLDGSEIDFVESYKYFGIWFDSKPTFETHITVLLTEGTSRIGFLYSKKKLLHILQNKFSCLVLIIENLVQQPPFPIMHVARGF